MLLRKHQQLRQPKHHRLNRRINMDSVKHIAKSKITGVNLIVVFRKIPDDETHCLVVQPDRLRDFYRDAIIEATHSRDAQATVNLYDVLTRKQFSDGTFMLPALHSAGFLIKMRVVDVLMTPTRNVTIPLKQINFLIDSPNATESEFIAMKDEEEKELVKLDPYLDEISKFFDGKPTDEAELPKWLYALGNKLIEFGESRKKDAIALDPSVKPGKKSKAEQEVIDVKHPPVKQRVKGERPLATKVKTKNPA